MRYNMKRNNGSNKVDSIEVFGHQEDGGVKKTDPIKDVIFKYTPPPVFDVKPLPVSESEIKKQLQEINNELGKLIEKKRIGTKVMVKALTTLVFRFGKLIFKCKKLQEEKQRTAKERRKISK
jgi:hypothetical protein